MELANNCNRAEYTHNISIIGEHNCSKTVFDYLAKQGNESERSSTQFVPADDYYLHPCTLSFETTEFHYSITLINTPGHSEFIDEAIAALWITDGAIVVVDCQVGITQHTIDVVQKAVAEHVKLLLLFDNVESWLNQPTEEVLDVLHSNLWKINSRVPLVHDRFALGSKNVLFGSTEHKWIITPFQLARSFKTSSAHADGTLETCVRGLCEILEACKSSSPAERLSEQLTIVPGGRFAEDQRDSVLFHSVMQTLSSIEQSTKQWSSTYLAPHKRRSIEHFIAAEVCTLTTLWPRCYRAILPDLPCYLSARLYGASEARQQISSL